MSCPQPSPGQRLRRAVDADHGAVGSHQVGGHESHVSGPAAQIQHPHAGQDARLSEDHPRRRGQRRALRLKAAQLVVTDTTAELVAGVAVTHRVFSFARPATIILRLASGLARLQAPNCQDQLRYVPASDPVSLHAPPGSTAAPRAT